MSELIKSLFYIFIGAIIFNQDRIYEFLFAKSELSEGEKDV